MSQVEQVDTYHSMIANEDLRLARFTIVKITCWSDAANSPLIEQCDTQGEKMCGILCNNPNTGEVGQVARVGKCPVVLAEALACQRSWTTDAAGHAMGALAADWVGGMAHEPGTLSPTPTGYDKGTVDLETLNPWHAHAAFTE